jgi:hypothetical protein
MEGGEEEDTVEREGVESIKPERFGNPADSKTLFAILKDKLQDLYKEPDVANLREKLGDAE